MAEREGLLKTLAVAAGVALSCSLLVSTAVYWLRPMQLAYADIERNRAILVAAGLAPRGEPLEDRDIVARFVELQTRLFDRLSGQFSTDIDTLNYDFRAASADPTLSTAVPAELDIAGIGTEARYLPVYLASDGSGERVVMPFYGLGMWSTIQGFIGVSVGAQTIAGIAFYEHGETPGLGDRIENPDWLALWPGKHIYAGDGTVQLYFASEQRDATQQYRIDAITGATVTVAAVERMLHFWLGPEAYGPALQLLADEAAGGGERR